MQQIIAILFEDIKEQSYIAIQLDGEEPEILFTKGPTFNKTMGPFPVPYAEATFKRWNYCRVTNPPTVDVGNKESLMNAMQHIQRLDATSARYSREQHE